MKNHYVSRLILKRFSETLNTYNLLTGELRENVKPDKVFYKKDAFDVELEKLMNFNIESKFANIIDKKIIGQTEVKITRYELYIIKKFMLISSIRNYPPEGFFEFMKKFRTNVDKYIKINPIFKNMKSMGDLGDVTPNEFFLKTLRVFASCDRIEDFATNKDATKEMLAWALPFLESYLAFWDAADNEEFILTSSGMTTEYEGIRVLTGFDISKVSFLLHKILIDDKPEYAKILNSQHLMYENYNIFNLTSTRCMVMINPFFNLYNNYKCFFGDKLIIADKPDIWPAIIQNRELFKTPQKKPIIDEKLFLDDDIFIYKPVKMDQLDTIYINSLFLLCNNGEIGFGSIDKIADSLEYIIIREAFLKSQLTKDDKELFNHVHSHPIYKLIENKIDYFKIMLSSFFYSEIEKNIFKDVQTNKYILEYYQKYKNEILKAPDLNAAISKKDRELFFNDLISKQKKEKNNV